MNTTNTTNYSMAIFSCVAIAVLTFFFPLGVDSRYWTTIVIGILLIFTCLLYIKQDELKAELGRSFNSTLALVMSYVLEVVLIALVLVIAAAKNGETTLGLKPDDAAALNLRAAVEMAKGDAKAAEKTLDQAIRSNPRGYHAYYNMARLMAAHKGNLSGAKRYYEAGRSFGGPVDAKLEEILK